MVEVLVASAVFAVVMLLAMSAFAELLQATNSQTSITTADAVANQAMREMSGLLRSSVLPVLVPRTKEDYEKENDAFYDIDNEKWGFGGENGDEWRTALQNGMDTVAFVQPVDAQGVDDFLDSKKHLQLGVVRGGKVYLSASATGTPGTGNDFVIRNQSTTAPYELVNALAATDPADFVSDHFDKLDLSTSSFDWWDTDGLGSQPGVSCFIAIRFAPLLEGPSGGRTPVLLTEAELSTPTRKVDLDGDGEIDGVFQVGRMQVVYSGSEGEPFYYVDGSNIRTENSVQPLVLNLTPGIVLRKQVASDRTPIFRLVDNRVSTGKRTASAKAMAIKMLVLDTEAITIGEDGRKTFSKGTRNFSARWYETIIGLKNMER